MTFLFYSSATLSWDLRVIIRQYFSLATVGALDVVRVAVRVLL
jgi:hypothetical protein